MCDLSDQAIPRAEGPSTEISSQLSENIVHNKFTGDIIPQISPHNSKPVCLIIIIIFRTYGGHWPLLFMYYYLTLYLNINELWFLQLVHVKFVWNYKIWITRYNIAVKS